MAHHPPTGAAVTGQVSLSGATADRVAGMVDIAKQAAMQQVQGPTGTAPVAVATEVVIPRQAAAVPSANLQQQQYYPPGQETPSAQGRSYAERVSQAVPSAPELQQKGRETVQTGIEAGQQALQDLQQRGQQIASQVQEAAEAGTRSVKETLGVPPEEPLAPALAQKTAEVVRRVPEKASHAAGAATGMAVGATKEASQAAAAAAGTVAGTAAGAANAVARHTFATLETPLRVIFTAVYQVGYLLVMMLMVLRNNAGRIYSGASYLVGAGSGAAQGALEAMTDREAFERGRRRFQDVLRVNPVARAREVAASVQETAQQQLQAGKQRAQEGAEKLSGAVGVRGRGAGEESSLGYGHGIVQDLGRVQPERVGRSRGEQYPGETAVPQMVNRLEGAAASGVETLQQVAKRAQRVTVEMLTPVKETFDRSYEASKEQTERRVDTTVEGEDQ